MTARPLRIPEIIQTSATDCGPACLKSLFGGLGVDVNYRRLRDACQTDVDGTSIDTMEEIAVELGFEAEQIMLPIEDVLLPEARVLPAIVVVRLPGGNTHFVVVWRRFGPILQVMDPASGRYFTTCSAFQRRLLSHTNAVTAGAWREWAGSKEALGVLARRVERLGVPRARDILDAAESDPTWHGLARLEAAVRAVQAMIDAGVVTRGKAAGVVLDDLVASDEQGRSAIPDGYRSIRRDPEGSSANVGDDEELLLTGAVVLRMREGAASEHRVRPELAKALAAPAFETTTAIGDLLRTEGLALLTGLFLAIGLVTGGRITQAVLLRALLDIGRDLATMRQRAVGLGVLLAIVLLLVVVQLTITRGLLALGRRLELRLRHQFFERLPRIDDRYFQSRLTSDMAARCHGIQTMRTLPSIVGQAVALGCELVATTVAISWMAPTAWRPALAAAAMTATLPWIAQLAFRERDLRLQTHNGALGRFSLDALLGLSAVRIHGAERSLRREQESLLVEWMKAGLGLQKIAVVFEGVLLAGTYAMVWLTISGYLASKPKATLILLLVFWALRYPIIGQRLMVLTRTYPSLVNRVHRLLEIMGPDAVREPDATTTPLRSTTGETERMRRGLTMTIAGGQVKVGGHVVLDDVDLTIPAGQHVAIVGPSGAGKSTLLGVLLGWYQPSAGRVTCDGRTLDAAAIDEIRRSTAWVDPSVQLWNAPLIDNLRYGNETSSRSLLDVLHSADLVKVLESLPDGLQSMLGENGGLVSGGEGQRIRLARSMLRPNTRLALLDEPFRGLDRERRHALLERSRELWRDATLICVTHDVSQTRRFDQILVVEDGRIVERGAPAELLSDPDSRYSALLQADLDNHSKIWNGDGWRRVWLDGGRLHERA